MDTSAGSCCGDGQRRGGVYPNLKKELAIMHIKNECGTFLKLTYLKIPK